MGAFFFFLFFLHAKGWEWIGSDPGQKATVSSASIDGNNTPPGRFTGESPGLAARSRYLILWLI